MLKVVVWIVCGCLLQYGGAQSTYGSGADVEVLPGSCTRSPYVVLGTPFQWQYPDGSIATEEDNCSFWEMDQLVQEWAFIDSQYTFFKTGDYEFQCMGELRMGHSGNFSVVPAGYTIALCKYCNSNKQYTINSKDLLRWTIAEINTECTIRVTNLEAGLPVYTGQGTDHYQFNNTGTYQIYCIEDTSISATITVTDNITDITHSDDDRYKALVYLHAALMGLTFGILLPTGAFLASHKYLLVHKIIQPIGIILALIGLVMVVAYVELTSGKHFGELIHGVVGLSLLILAFLLMPILLVKNQWRRWHRRTGHIVAFFGMGNVFLGLTILPASHAAALTVCILYGIWLVIAIVVYVIYPPRKDSRKSDETRADANTTEESTQVKVGRLGSIFSRQGSEVSGRGPQPLSKNIISETKMVELRKMSVDEDALRQRDARDDKLHLQQQYSKSDMEFFEPQRSTPSIDGECKEAKEVLLNELDNSQVVLLPAYLHQSSVEPDTPPPSRTSPDYTLHHVSASNSSDDEKGILRSSPSANKPPTPGTATVQRAHTFNVAHSNVDSDDAMSRAGSLRITRHSKRALNRSTGDVFPSSIAAMNELPQNEVQMATTTHKKYRKRGVHAPPPIILTAAPTKPSPLTLQPPVDPNQRASPSPSIGSAFSYHGGSPRPHRKKKVSMVQIETTIIPPTPITLEPPRSTGQPPEGLADNPLMAVPQVSHEAIICANGVGEIVFWGPGAVKMFGYTPGEAIGNSLEMIMPEKYKERHRQGIHKMTEDTLKYIRKHSFTPEEQKHARAHVVHGVAKNRHEFPVEVTVTTFVLDGELFYTGVIIEMARHRTLRAGSASSAVSDAHESTLKQKAMAVGAQMKIAHQLHSAEHISQRELTRVLSGSLQATKFEVEPEEMEQMVTGIMKAGDPTDSGVISFTTLIKLLFKHRLYISESGLISRYGKTKPIEQRTMSSRREQLADATKHFCYTQLSSIFWFLVYLALNILLMLIGVLATDREGWEQWAYGTGPVLSMNCVLVLLPTLRSLIQSMRNSKLMNSIFPLTHTLTFHLIIIGGIAFWTAIHLLTHFTSFAIDNRNKTEKSTTENFRDNFTENMCPVVTGFIILVIISIMVITSINSIRKQFQFIPFHIIHWVGAGLFYLLLILHGVDYYNPSFWKWLLPAVVIFAIERLYRHIFVEGKEGKRATVKNAGAYDDVSRTAVLELEKPKGFRFEPGQYVMLNIPWIAYFNWHTVHITSRPKDNKLTVYIQKEDDVWSEEVFVHLKAQGCQGDLQLTGKKVEEEEEWEEEVTHSAVNFTGPFGPGNDAIFDYKISTLVCGGNGPHGSKAIISKLLEYRKGPSCTCGYRPTLTKLYFIWVTPSENDFEWFTDYLSDLCEDDNLPRYLDIRVFLTNIDSHPDELASALLQLGLKTAGENCKVRRPSQPQLNNLYQMTSYGVPDFDSLLDYIQAHHANNSNAEFGVFTIGELHHTMQKDLQTVCIKHTEPGQPTFSLHHIVT